MLWLQRWFTDNYANVNVGIPSSAYIPHTFNDPGPDNLVGTGDDRPITLYDVAAPYVGQGRVRAADRARHGPLSQSRADGQQTAVRRGGSSRARTCGRATTAS